MFQAPTISHNNPLCQLTPLPHVSTLLLHGLSSNTWPHTLAQHHQHADPPVNEWPRTKGISAGEPEERVTTMTSWVSWKPGMKRLRTTPAQTHTPHIHTQGVLEQLKPPWEYESVEEGISVSLQQLKESGRAWNFRSCFLPHIPLPFSQQ